MTPYAGRKIFWIAFLILTGFSQLQAQQYAGRWKKVALLENQGLYKTALGEVQQVYRQAKQAGDRPEQIKALIYEMKYADVLKEDALVANIRRLSEESAAAGFPAKQILESMLAELYWNYLQVNRYRLYERPGIRNDQGTDIQTWSADRLNREIADHYWQSLEPAGRLQQVNIRDYNAIILRGKNTAGLRPALYDLLAQRALDYFTGEERDITLPADHFEIADPRAFAPAATFATAKFRTMDTASWSCKAVGIYQNLLRFHLRDAAPEALLDADIRRLQYMYRLSVAGSKDSLYLDALNTIREKYGSSPVSAEASYLAASLLYAQGNHYQPFGDTSSRWDIATAVKLCGSIVKKFPRSEGGIHCQSLLQTIREPKLGMETEKVNIPQKPLRTLINYRNLSVVHFRIARIPDQNLENLSRLQDTAYWNALLSLPSSDKWKISFPDPGDYQQHAAEIKVPALPPGSYMLTASGDSSFSKTENPLAAQLFFVSNISCTGDNRGNYFVLNRETGHPLEGARVQVWENKYDYTTRNYPLQKAEQNTTDANGYFKLRDSNRYRTVRLEFSWQKDYLFTGDYRWLYGVPEADRKREIRPHTFLFTDRSIYRPGQRIWFKGIMVTTDPETHKSDVVPAEKTAVYLYNTNGQIVDSLAFTTSEWGSYSGSFALPQGSLNGQMFLQDKTGGGRAFFSVEEYKRPSFYVDIKKPANTYRLGDTIRITGDAMAYAGADIDGATVKYRVVRLARFPFPWYYRNYGPALPSSPQMEIAQGVTRTGADGKFTLSFTAIPDRIISPNALPVFDYEVSVDVTDLNGETRSGSLTVPVGYRSLFLSLDLPAEITADSLRNISVITANLGGVFEPAKVTLTIYKLNPPERFIRKRYWQRPDQYVMDQNEYLKNFPHDEYANEADPSTWEKVEKISQRSQTTEADNRFDMDNQQIPPGWYLVEAAARDGYDREVKDQKFVQVYDDKQLALPFEAMLWTAPLKTTVEPGTSGSFLLGTSAKDLYGIQQVIRMNDTGKPSLVHLNKEVKRVSVPVGESDRGGIGYQYIFVRDNRIYTAYIPVKVPWDNKALNITYETFRDKLLPGSPEHWKLKITGSHGDQVAAEMLASMYDASLDAFRRHDWPPLDLYPVLSGAANWDQTGFSIVGAQQYFRWKNPLNLSYERTYDQLNWFGYLGRVRLRFPFEPRYERATSGVIAPARNFSYVTLNNASVMELSAREKRFFADTLNQGPVPPETTPGVRRNLQETAFFFPQLQTDKNGEITLDFTMPEALTRWKFMAFAHTKNLAYGYTQREVVTQKQLMVMPNPPRFFREGDRVALSAKIVNLSGKPLEGAATLRLFDAQTMQPVDGSFANRSPARHFSVPAGQSIAVDWPLDIPAHFTSALLWQITAKAGNYSDGEEDALPVLTNRVLVTETLPLPVRGNETKTFHMEKLLHSGASGTLQNHALTVEFTGNPAWYAVQALPSLSENTNGCSEQLFNRYYASVLAERIASSSPRIRKIFEQWKNADSSALMSNLEKNPDLKSALLDETPWVMEAKNETQQKHRIAELFDSAKIRESAAATLQQLLKMQAPNGGFAWFPGMPDDRYITQYILTGIGRLQHLSQSGTGQDPVLRQMADKAIAYLDARTKEDYDLLIRNKRKLEADNLANLQVQYLYMRIFFAKIPVADSMQTAYHYYLRQAAKYWLKKNPYLQGMIALALHRSGDRKTAAAILRSLKETAITDKETGMHWKEMTEGYYWYQAPVETESLLIGAFAEIGRDREAVNEMKTWLLKQKQAQNWRTTRATADAVYALLMEGSDWLHSEENVRISLGAETLSSEPEKTEAGTGYFLKKFSGGEVKPEMGNITVKTSGAGTGEPAWGAVYWQYFEQLDKTTPAASPLTISKQLFVERNAANGPALTPVTGVSALKLGDKIRVRIELRVDRDMEYVHLRNMRAGCFEPVNVLSGYRWQGGAGYYQTTKDASTDFFFGHLARGSYVFDIPLFVAGRGDFSTGITTVQCLYAPEFSSHSGGGRIKVQ